MRPVWYKSKDLELIKDVYRGTTVFYCSLNRLLLERWDKGDWETELGPENIESTYLQDMGAHLQ
jgi:hypothetical protein